jgi:hypothetical protein
LTGGCQAILRHKKTGHSIIKCPVFKMNFWFYITLPQELRAPELPELHQEPPELHQEPPELHQEPREHQEHQERQEPPERGQGPRS